MQSPNELAAQAEAQRLAAANKLLQVSEMRYRRLFEAAQDGILLLNAKTSAIEDANPYLVNMLGFTRAEFLGKKIWEVGAFKDTALSKQAFLELQENRYIRYDDLPLVAKDGTRISVEFISNVYDCAGTLVIQCNIRDNTERRRAETALKATARALKMRSDGNEALLGSKTESALLAEYCRIAVETGGYRMAWIGVPDEGEGKKVTNASHFGYEDGYLELDKVSWSDTARGQEPTGAAIRSGQIQFVHDISADPKMTPWRTEALKRGYRSAISVPFLLPSQLVACLTLYSSALEVWSEAEEELLRHIADDISFGVAALQTSIDKDAYQASLRKSLEQTIEVIAATLDERDSYTAGHQRRVADLCSKISDELGLCEDRKDGLRLAASIHDLGKIGIPVELLTKPVALTKLEFGMIKEHSIIGYNIIKNVSFPWPIADIIAQHHERLDGSGYPKGLMCDEILFESKILAVADVVEAMASHRPYRAALGIDAALNEIDSKRDTSFDAEVVDACLRVFREQNYRIELH